ncbi:MAG: diguanylate cyclase [Actinobacteria bacterium]|nr:diguanylate cyclase [Actinomycetota bacterium]
MTVPIVTLVVATALGYSSRSRSNDALRDLQQTYDVTQALNQVQDSLTNAETGMRGYLLTGRPAYLGPYQEGVIGVPVAFRQLAELVQGNPAQEQRVVTLENLSVERLTILERLQPYAPIGKNRRAVIALLSQGNDVMGEIRNLLTAMAAQERVLLADRQARLAAARHTSFLIQIVALPAGAFAGLLLVLIFVTALVRRIRQVEENARLIEEGMPPRDPPPGKDEVARLGRAIAHTGTRLIELQGELRHMAVIDTQTRLLNRRGFMPAAQNQLETARRQLRPVALLFVDLDGLKAVNDSLGHRAGDAMIAEAAHVLKETFRSSDLMARMGGDEFCVMLTTDPAPDVQGALQRLGSEVAARNAEPGRPYRLSFSVGAAEFDPASPCTLDELLERADNLMYEHKRGKVALAPVDQE